MLQIDCVDGMETGEGAVTEVVLVAGLFLVAEKVCGGGRMCDWRYRVPLDASTGLKQSAYEIALFFFC